MTTHVTSNLYDHMFFTCLKYNFMQHKYKLAQTSIGCQSLHHIGCVRLDIKNALYILHSNNFHEYFLPNQYLFLAVYIFHLMLPLPLLLQGLGTFQLHSQAALRGLTPHSVCLKRQYNRVKTERQTCEKERNMSYMLSQQKVYSKCFKYKNKQSCLIQ